MKLFGIRSLMMAYGVLACAALAAPATAQFAGATELIPDHYMVPGNTIVSLDGRFTLAFQTDRNLVLYQGSTPLWSARTNVTGCTPPPGSTFCTKPIIQTIVFQSDGNFVAYDQIGIGYGISKTDKNPGSHMYLQSDGNMVIYNASNRAIWSTKTCCH